MNNPIFSCVVHGQRTRKIKLASKTPAHECLTGEFCSMQVINYKSREIHLKWKSA